MRGSGLQCSLAAADGRREGQAFLAAQFAGDDPPAVGGARGQATDIEIQAQEILYLRRKLNQIYVDHTGQPLEKIERDMERDRFMSAETAKEYGLIDEVLNRRAIETVKSA